MTFGMAINITPPDDALTRLLLHLGMLAATGVVIAILGWPLARQAGRELARRRITMELLFWPVSPRRWGFRAIRRSRAPGRFTTKWSTCC